MKTPDLNKPHRYLLFGDVMDPSAFPNAKIVNPRFKIQMNLSGLDVLKHSAEKIGLNRVSFEPDAAFFFTLPPIKLS